jgi:rhamnosyltransferase
MWHGILGNPTCTKDSLEHYARHRLPDPSLRAHVVSGMEATLRIAAVLLTHRPDQGILRRAVASLCPQVERMVIVDNGSRWDAQSLLNALPVADRGRIEFIWLDTNVGVGAGHNRGIQWARTSGYSHVLLLDHDSIPRPDMVRHLVAALDRLGTQRIPVSAVAARYVDRYTGRIAPFVRLGFLKLVRVTCGSAQMEESTGESTREPTREPTGELLETDFIISSGALIPMPVLGKVGDMDEGLFIDHVDTEWILRCKAQGYRSFGVCDAVMEHSVGNTTFRFWFGRWRNTPLHNPERDYYLFRNSLNLYRMPYAPWRWIASDFLRLLGLAIIFPAFAPDRWRRIRLIARGVWHGLRGVTGPIR